MSSGNGGHGLNSGCFHIQYLSLGLIAVKFELFAQEVPTKNNSNWNNLLVPRQLDANFYNDKIICFGIESVIKCVIYF